VPSPSHSGANLARARAILFVRRESVPAGVPPPPTASNKPADRRQYVARKGGEPSPGARRPCLGIFLASANRPASRKHCEAQGALKQSPAGNRTKRHASDQRPAAARIEPDSDHVADLHLWRPGPGQLAAIISVASHAPREPGDIRNRLAAIPSLSHLTVEVERTVQPLRHDAAEAKDPPNHQPKQSQQPHDHCRHPTNGGSQQLNPGSGQQSLDDVHRRPNHHPNGIHRGKM
jgi:hypothetical protein